VSSPLLTILKYVFLAVLYLFFLRVLRAVWIELREPKVATVDRVVPATETQLVPAITRSGPDPDPQGSSDALVEVTPDGRALRRFPLGKETSLGRSPGCGIALPDDTFVSQVHARVFRRDGRVWIEDLGSTNGTYVNEARIGPPVPLEVGDRVQLGQTVLELSS
jgi:hypothetical protein